MRMINIFILIRFSTLRRSRKLKFRISAEDIIRINRKRIINSSDSSSLAQYRFGFSLRERNYKREVRLLLHFSISSLAGFKISSLSCVKKESLDVRN